MLVRIVHAPIFLTLLLKVGGELVQKLRPAFGRFGKLCVAAPEPTQCRAEKFTSATQFLRDEEPKRHVRLLG